VLEGDDLSMMITTPMSMRPWNVSDPDLPCDFSRPELAEQSLRSMLAERSADGSALPDERGLEILTQLARVQALQGDLDQAQDTLRTVAKHLPSEPASSLRLRYFLELGRVATLMRTPSRARPMFLDVWNEAQTRDRFLAIDAAHMLAQIEPQKSRVQWIESALGLALESSDPRVAGWRSSLHEALGWHFYELLRFDKARECFERARECARAQGNAERDIDASYALGKVLRASNRFDEALVIQLAVLAQLGRTRRVSGLVHEEIAECLHALKRIEDARSHFAIAHEHLSKDTWLADNQPARLSRLKKLAKTFDRSES
jgi:tetratricopeptide (TPR) repeat protein